MHTSEVVHSYLTILHAYSLSHCYPPPFLCTCTLLCLPLLYSFSSSLYPYPFPSYFQRLALRAKTISLWVNCCDCSAAVSKSRSNIECTSTRLLHLSGRRGAVVLLHITTLHSPTPFTHPHTYLPFHLPLSNFLHLSTSSSHDLCFSSHLHPPHIHTSTLTSTPFPSPQRGDDYCTQLWSYRRPNFCQGLCVCVKM